MVKQINHSISDILTNSVVRRICAYFQGNCAFCHKSVKLGTALDEYLRFNLNYGDILKLSCEAFGSHFPKWRP